MSGTVGQSEEQDIIGAEGDDGDIRAQIACQNLVIHAFRLIDGGQAGKLRAFFTEDGAHTLNDQIFSGEALTKFLNDRQAMVDRQTRHCVHNMAFARLGPDRAEIHSICVVYLLSLEDDAERRTARGIVDFRDEFVRSAEGRWRFSRREATIIAGER